MEELSNYIKLNYIDEEINSLINNTGKVSVPFARHFNQSEEFFLKLTDEYTVPHLPIHHDVRKSIPSPEYLKGIRNVLSQIISLLPDIFHGLIYFFDPGEILKANFYRLFNLNNKYYLNLITLDLKYKHQSHLIIKEGSNDFTPYYKSRHLYIEITLIPLEQVIYEKGNIKALKIRELVSQTWIGEKGRGYFVQGIWIDDDLTKFFSKLFLPWGKKTYPYYPFICKYKTVCYMVIDFQQEDQKIKLLSLDYAIGFLKTVIEKIQESLKNQKFSEDISQFKKLKAKVPDSFYNIWKNLNIKAYLNENDMKEYLVED